MKNNMLKFKKFIFVVLLVITSNSFAQNYYIPLNIQKAYENGTRSSDGKPGANYWQNSSDYNIDVELNTKEDIIKGEAIITYHNNSPDTLKRIILRLYQDFFRKGNARQWPIPDGDISDGVQITKLRIGNNEYDPDSDFPNWWMTNLSIRLKDPITPGSDTEIKIEWNFKLPTVRGLRMRKYDDGHYFIAYWYPQVAVYDDIDGWDMIEYLGMVEFYNDFNNYDVKITMPGDYVVWATGEVQNRDEVLNKEIIERYKKATESDEVIRIITQEDYENGIVTIRGNKHTWHFKAEYVPDFSFAASNKSNWDGVSLVVDSLSGRRVLTDVIYPENSDNWERAAEVSRASVEYMSFILPGVPFPYSHVTSFSNGTPRGGMETPMMANNGVSRRFTGMVILLFHEISHNYFPFYMGTNERKYAWMDEGWAVYLPTEIVNKYAPDYNYFGEEVEGYFYMAGHETELPLMVPTFQHNSWSSGRTAAYTRPAVAYHLLRETMGDKLFKRALKEYISRWNGKHPLPFDFFNTFEEIAGEDLEWFFQPWFFEFRYPDLAIKEVRTDNIVVVEKIGNMPVPVDVTWWYEDGTSDMAYYSTAIWKDGKSTFEIILPKEKKIEKIEIGSETIPDVDKENNIWEADTK